MKKRIILSILFIGLALSQMACSAVDKDNTETMIGGDNKENDSDVKAPNNLDVPAEKPVAELEYDYFSLEDSESNSSSSYCGLKVEKENYEKLSEAVDIFFKEYRASREKVAKEQELAAKEYEINNPESFWFNMSNYVDVMLCDNRIFSIVITNEKYVSHYTEYDTEYSDIEREYIAINFDSLTGEIIDYSDLGEIGDDLKASFSDIHEIEDDNALTDNVEDVMASYVTDDKCDVPFYLDGRGVNLIYSPEIITGKKTEILECAYTLTTSYENLPGFNPNYRPSTNNYKIALEEYRRQDTFVDIDGDGVKEKLEVSYKQDEWEWIENATVKVGDKELTVPLSSAEGLNTYLWHVDGKNYIELDEGASNDWHTANIILVEEDLINCGEFSGELKELTTEGFTVETRIDELGTWGVSKDYKFVGDGKVEPVDGFYHMLSGYEPAENDDEEMWTHLVVKQQFSDRNGQEIEAGTKLYPVYSDGKNFIVFKDVNGNLYEIETTEPEDEYTWGKYINGINAEELFEMLPYAG